MRQFLDDFLPVFVVTAVMAGAIIFLVGFAALADRQQCIDRTRKMQIESSWGIFQGCMINIKSQWLPWSEVVPVEVDGKVIFTAKPHVRLGSEPR